MLVQDFLEQAAENVPDKTALIFKDQRLSYEQINCSADKIAAFLITLGVKRHDRVAIFMDNSVESIVGLFGVLKASATFVILSATMKPKKLNYVLNDSGSCVLMTNKTKSRVIKESIQGCSSLKHVVWCGIENHGDDGGTQLPDPFLSWSWHGALEGELPDPPAKYQKNIDVDLSNIIYTSGSTGEPKGVMSAHYNVVSATRSISSYLCMNDQDIVLNVLPLSFDYSLYQVFMTFFVRGTVVLEKIFTYPYDILERVAAEKVTGLPLVPTIAALILQIEDLSEFDFSSLRYISNTAAALPVRSIRQLQQAFPEALIFSMYGLTECKRVSYLPPEDIERKPGSVGIAMPNEDVFIVDDQGNELNANEVGELVIRGSNVMQGYWNDPEATDRVFRKGRYRGETLLYSGDLFKKDDEGYLYFVSRKDDMIKTKGERVSPKEIEAILHELKGVSEAFVFGVPDPVLGQAIVATMVPEKGISLSAKIVRKHCTQNLEPFMVPKYIEFADEFPTLASGKINKKLITQIYLSNLEQ